METDELFDACTEMIDKAAENGKQAKFLVLSLSDFEKMRRFAKLHFSEVEHLNYYVVRFNKIFPFTPDDWDYFMGLRLIGSDFVDVPMIL